MSSWKKASKSNQKTHKERHQPANRAHLGLLEKKKDYKERAKDRYKKQRTLQLLRKRALDKNPDEFYFHMINSKVVDNVHHELEKEDEHTPEQIRLMQTQDLRYIATKRTIESKKIDRLQGQLHLLDVANKTPNTHLFFVDSKEEANNFDIAEKLDTHPALLDRKINRLKLCQLTSKAIPCVSETVSENATSIRNQKYKELSKRIKREKELAVIQQKLEIKRHLLDKKHLPPKKINPGTKDKPPVYLWPYERKR